MVFVLNGVNFCGNIFCGNFFAAGNYFCDFVKIGCDGKQQKQIPVNFSSYTVCRNSVKQGIEDWILNPDSRGTLAVLKMYSKVLRVIYLY